MTPDLKPCPLKAALDFLYSEEQNVCIQSFWDAGYVIQLGDSANGFNTCVCVECEDLDEGMTRFLKLYHEWRADSGRP